MIRTDADWQLCLRLAEQALFELDEVELELEAEERGIYIGALEGYDNLLQAVAEEMYEDLGSAS